MIIRRNCVPAKPSVSCQTIPCSFLSEAKCLLHFSKEKELIEQLDQKKQITDNAREIQLVKEVVRSFVHNFQKFFDSASLYEKKQFLQK
jgi:hypothetical protein